MAPLHPVILRAMSRLRFRTIFTFCAHETFLLDGSLTHFYRCLTKSEVLVVHIPRNNASVHVLLRRMVGSLRCVQLEMYSDICKRVCGLRSAHRKGRDVQDSVSEVQLLKSVKSSIGIAARAA